MPYDRSVPTILAVALTLALSFQHASAQDSVPADKKDDAPAKADAAPASAEATPTTGILPVPDYTGDIWTRPALTGDWGGTRSDLADKGIQFELTWTQYVQSITSGGRDSSTAYGGKGDFLINVDLDRMGVLPGALVTFRGESRYGESVNAESGLLLPVNNDFFFPLTDRVDEDIPFTITTLLYTQYLSETFGVFLGKFDTLNGDPNEFASGRGTTQFMNADFIYNPALALRMPYSTLGGGAVWLPAKWLTLSTSIFNTADSSTTSGFDDFGDGLTWTVEAASQYRLDHLPGGVNVGALYSFDQDFTKVGDRLAFRPGEGLVVPTEDETWAVYWSGWQYLWVEDPSDELINAGDGRADHQGLGLFARLGFADVDTNPIDWAGSIGVGGRGLIPSRDNDTFGVGYFYNSLQDTNFTGLLGIGDQTQGIEAYYDIVITPAAHLTLDAQVVEPAAPNTDTAVVLGARLKLSF